MSPAAAPFAYREHHAALGSTNDRAMTLAARPDTLLPVLVTATRQTRGRGRHGKTWESRPGDVIATALFEIDPTDAAGLARASVGAGLCLLESVAGRHPELTGRLALKWPNDVWLDGRKLAGVLVETRPTAGRTRLAVGFGLNTAGGSGLREDAASVTADAEDLRVAIGGRIVAALPGLITNGLPEERLAEVDGLRGREVAVETPGGRVAGVAAGLTAEGSLTLSADAGPVTLYDGSVVTVGTSGERAPSTPGRRAGDWSAEDVFEEFARPKPGGVAGRPEASDPVKSRWPPFPLPDDYLAFVDRTGGGEGFLKNGEYLALWPPDSLSRFNRECGVECVTGVALFGSNGGGEFFGFKAFGDGAIRVVRIPAVGMSEEDCEIAADSFSAFVDPNRRVE